MPPVTQRQPDDLGYRLPLCKPVCCYCSGRLYVYPLPELDPAVLLPAWAFLGEYDSAGVAELVEDNGTVKALQGWNAHNATNEAAVAESSSYNGAFVTKSFMGGNAPLVKYTVVKDTPTFTCRRRALPSGTSSSPVTAAVRTAPCTIRAMP